MLVVCRGSDVVGAPVSGVLLTVAAGGFDVAWRGRSGGLLLPGGRCRGSERRVHRVHRVLVGLLVGVLTAGLVAGVPSAATGAAVSGSGGSGFTFMSSAPDGSPHRWFPCLPLTWQVAWNGTKPSAAELKVLSSAFAEVSKATGLKFAFKGESPVAIASDLYAPADARGVDVVVSFARPGSGPGRSPLIGGQVAGQGGRRVGGPNWAGYAHTGGAVFNAELLAGMPWQQRRAAYMHELGHVIGLGHVDGDHLMSPVIERTSWSSGDRAGLRRLGRQSGDCSLPSESRPVTGKPGPVTGLVAERRADGSVLLRWSAPAQGSRATSFVVRVRVSTPARVSDLDTHVDGSPFVVPASTFTGVPAGGSVEVWVWAANRFGVTGSAPRLVLLRR